MWLNDGHISDAAIQQYRKSLMRSRPNYVVIDGLFNQAKLDELAMVLQQSNHWQTQQHSYSALYVDDTQWQQTSDDQRFVQRDVWQRQASTWELCSDNTLTTDTSSTDTLIDSLNTNLGDDFLSYLRGDEFMSLLSRIFKVTITDINVADPNINTNYFRLGTDDFVELHADDSPGREVCMLIYLNKQWQENAGGELVFAGTQDKNIAIAPLFNRCVLFDPASAGSEHWVKRLNAAYADQYRYNITSWYWSE